MYDVIIVGMGIGGITAGIYAKRANLNVLLLDKSAPGGLLNNIDLISNYPGFIDIKGPDLANYLFNQVKSMEIPYKLEEVTNIKINDDTKKIVRWQKIVNDASRQAKRNVIPEVFNIMNLEDITKLDYDLKILCTVNELSMSLKNILQNNKKCGTMIIVIGPEGGFKKDEEDYLISHGFISTKLLDFVLRTETASIVALSMINYEYTR